MRPDHDCTGAECVTCGVPPVGRVVFGSPAWPRSAEPSPPRVSHGRAPRLATFRDSRGLAVPRWPTAVRPSATVVIRTQGDPLNQPWTIVVHQRQDNGWWGLPGGCIEIGESITDCAKREALEETGLSIYLDQLTSVDSDPQQHAICNYGGTAIVQYVNCTFLARILTGTLKMSDESVALRWCHTDALPEPFLPAHQWRLCQAIAVANGGMVGVR